MADREFYETAYWRVVSTIEAPKEQLATMLPELVIAHLAQNFPQGKALVKKYLPDGTWLWPAYKAFVSKRDMEFYQADLADLRSCSPSSLITCLKSNELRALYKEFAGDKVKLPGRKNAEIANALLDVLTADQMSALAERLRAEAIAELELPGTPDYNEMTVLLLRRISMVAYNLQREAQLRENAKLHPNLFSRWKFVASEITEIPEKCRQMNGKVFRYDDPIWNGFPPCDYLDCCCSITLGLSGEQA